MADYARNKKAYLNYEILEKYEAGIELRGFEVKSIKNGGANLYGAFVVMRDSEAFLTNASIAQYQPANMPAYYEATRARRLLLHKKEITELVGRTQQKGLTLVPLRLYNKAGKIKLEFAFARGKKKYDKREAIKEKDVKRKIEKTFRIR